AVVEQVLGGGVVDGDDRVGQGAFPFHLAQPDDPGGGLLGAHPHLAALVGAPRVQQGDGVAPLVCGDVVAGVQGGFEVPVVAGVVDPAAGEHVDAVVLHQRGRGVV